MLIITVWNWSHSGELFRNCITTKMLQGQMATHWSWSICFRREISREVSTWRDEGGRQGERLTWQAEGADWILGNVCFSPVASPTVNSSGFKGTSLCPAADDCDWRQTQQRWWGGGGEEKKRGDRNKQNRMRGGTRLDNFFYNRWAGDVGGYDSKVK